MTNRKNGVQNKYIYVTIPTKGRNSKLALVSRLVCMAFHPIENPEQYQCDHINNDPTDNRSSNVRWLTRKANNNKKHARQMRSKNARRTDRSKQFIKATNVKTGEVVIYKNGASAAKGIGCSTVLIYNVISGTACANTAKGWRVEWISRDLPEAAELRNRLAHEQMAKELKLAQAKLELKLLKKKMRARMKLVQKELKRKQKELESRQLEDLRRDGREARDRMLWSRHAILQFTQDGEFVREWKSIAEAQKATGITTIGNCVKGFQKAAGGFVWKKKTDVEG